MRGAAFDFLHSVTCARFTTFSQGYFRIAIKIDDVCINPFSDSINLSGLVKRHMLDSFTNSVADKIDELLFILRKSIQSCLGQQWHKLMTSSSLG